MLMRVFITSNFMIPNEYSFEYANKSFIKGKRETPRDVVANVLDCDIVMCKFELQSRLLSFSR